MAMFEPAVTKLLDLEGGYVCDPDDPGGKTNHGITKRSYPDIDIKALTRDDAIRIYRHGTESPDQLLGNPKNYRMHPKNQQEPLHASLETIGWLQDIIVNVRSGEAWPPGDRNVETVVDGHLRITLALRHNQPAVPVKYVDLSPDEEAIALATLDPLASLAVADKEKLDALLREMPDVMDARLQEMMAGLAASEGLLPVEISENNDSSLAGVDSNECPKCGFQW